MPYSSNPIAKTKDSRSALFLIALMVGGIFLLDWTTPLGYAVWLLYAIPLLLTAWTARRGYAYGLALLCTLLIVTVIFLSPSGTDVPVAIFNRLLGSGVLWTTAVLLERRKQVEGARRESEQRFLVIFESAAVPIALARWADGVLVNVNEQWVKTFGYAKQEALGKTSAELGVNRDPEGRAHLLSELQQHGSVRDVEMPLFTRSGEARIVSNSSDVVALGGEKYLLSTIHDITPRKQAEEALRQLTEELEQRVAQRTAALGESQALLHALADGIPDPLYVKDRESRVVMANPALAAVVGKPLEEILGRTDGEYYGDDAAGQALREHDLQVMASGRSEVMEETVPTPLGDRTFLSTKAPHRDAAGHIVGIIGVSRDITERKQMEEALRESEERYRQLFRSMQEGFFLAEVICDDSGRPVDGRVLDANPAFGSFTGLNRDDVVGRTAREVLPTVEEEWIRGLGQVALKGEPAHLEGFVAALGRYFAVAAYSPRPGQVAAFFSDITVRKQAEEERERLHEQLLAVERARADLAENLNREIAHRTKNNLAMVAGLLQVQMARQRTPETAKTLSEAISRVLTFASIQQEMQAGAEGWVDLLPILRRVGAASGGALPGVTVVVSVSGEAVPLPSKAATNLAVAANELITNAIKHGAPGPDGKLRVDVLMDRTDEGRSLRLCVWNSGNPVPEEFDLSGQPGMGLQLVRDLAAGQYGGAFDLKPESGGTLAEVIVPLEELQKG